MGIGQRGTVRFVWILIGILAFHLVCFAGPNEDLAAAFGKLTEKDLDAFEEALNQGAVPNRELQEEIENLIITLQPDTRPWNLYIRAQRALLQGGVRICFTDPTGRPFRPAAAGPEARGKRCFPNQEPRQALNSFVPAAAEVPQLSPVVAWKEKPMPSENLLREIQYGREDLIRNYVNSFHGYVPINWEYLIPFAASHINPSVAFKMVKKLLNFVPDPQLLVTSYRELRILLQYDSTRTDILRIIEDQIRAHGIQLPEWRGPAQSGNF